MAAPEFPAGLPGVSSLKLNTTDQTISPEGEAGFLQYRRLTRVPHATATVTFRFLDEDFAVFQDFYVNTLNRGHKWFQLVLPSAGGYLPHVVRCLKHRVANSAGYNHREVSMELEIRGRRLYADDLEGYPGPSEEMPSGFALSETSAPPNPFVLSDGNKTAAATDETFGPYAVQGLMTRSTGRHYFELVVNDRYADGNSGGIGVAYGIDNGLGVGLTYNLGGLVRYGEEYPDLPEIAQGDVIGFAVNFDSFGFNDDDELTPVEELPPGFSPAVLIWISQNNVWLDGGRDGSVWTGPGDPVESAYPQIARHSFGNSFFPFAYRDLSNNIGVTLHEDLAELVYPPPTGFLPWRAP